MDKMYYVWLILSVVGLFMLGYLFGRFGLKEITTGQIIIEEYPDEHDFYRFMLPTDLDELKKQKKIALEVKVIKMPENMKDEK